MENFQTDIEIGLTEPTLLIEFDRLQEKLVPLWKEIGRSDPGGPVQEENTVVVVPSLSVDLEINAELQRAYEEHFLFLLFLLRQPRIRLIFVTSQTIPTQNVDYYLGLIPGLVASSARKRLYLLSPQDASHQPLSKKILERPHLIREIQSLIPNPDRAHIVPFNTTNLERELAIRMGIPMYAADPRYFLCGTKSGGRRIFREEGVPFPLGEEDLFKVDDLIEAIVDMRSQKPELRKVIVKLNEGVGGMGNATVSLENLPPPNSNNERKAIADLLQAMQFELDEVTSEFFFAKLREGGAIVEEMIEGEIVDSPSVQLRISPLGEVEMLSTHDQILGGPTGQTYLGAKFPADTAYGWLIAKESLKIGRRLVKEGVIGRFAVDFIVVQTKEGNWLPYAIEVNLRKGGTTAPYLVLQYLTDGTFDAEHNLFTTSRGDPKYYVCSDHVESPRYRVLTVENLLDLVSHQRLHFDHNTQTGIVFHMLSGISGLGRVGATAIGNSPEQTAHVYQRLVDLLEKEAKIAAG